MPLNIKESYLKVTEALRLGLKDFYPDLDYAPCKDLKATHERQKSRICFEEPSCYDLLWNGKKVMGASQRRIGSAVLHQATVFLKEDGKSLAKKIIAGFEKSWKVSFEERGLMENEKREALKIEAERYSSTEWAFGLPGR